MSYKNTWKMDFNCWTQSNKKLNYMYSISTLLSALMPIKIKYTTNKICVKNDSMQNTFLSFTWQFNVPVLNLIVQRFCNKERTCSVTLNFNLLFDALITDIGLLKIAITLSLVLWYKICTYRSQIFEYS